MPLSLPTDELDDERDRRKAHGRRELDRTAALHCRDPVEDLDAGRNRNRHAGGYEEHAARCQKPTVNMWCAHTPKLKRPIATVEAAMKPYPKIGLRENTGITSEIIPNAGSAMI